MLNIIYAFETVQRGGAEFLVLNICKELIKNQQVQSIHLLVYRKVKNDLCNLFEENGIHIHTLELSEKSNLFYRFYTIRKMLIKIRPNVVHCHSTLIDRDILFVSKLLNISGRYSTIHNIWLGRNIKSRINYLIVSLMANKIIAVSKSAINFYLENKLFFKNKLQIIYNGYGIDTCNVKPHDSIQDSSNIQIINVGALRIEKGQIYLIRAMRILEEQNVPVHLTIYGDDRYDGYGEKLYKEAEGLKNVTFFGGTSDVKSAYEQADIYVTASVSEAMPITLLEALGMGVPIVASDIDPHKEILGMLDNSIVVKKRNPEVLAEGIKTLINDNIKYKEYSQACFDLSKSFHINNTAENHLKMYERFNDKRT